MEIKSISDLNNFSLYIFDLDNTIYNEDDYLFQAYKAIAAKFVEILPDQSKNELFRILKDIYLKEGREKLFDKFLDAASLNNSYLTDCLKILRFFKPDKPLEINKKVKEVLKSLKSHGKCIFILTNGNVDQQKNKIRHIKWDGLDKGIEFVFADNTEPKPSPAGVFQILEVTGIGKDKTVFIGDSDTDKICARDSGISYLDVRVLSDPPFTEGNEINGLP